MTLPLAPEELVGERPAGAPQSIATVGNATVTPQQSPGEGAHVRFAPGAKLADGNAAQPSLFAAVSKQHDDAMSGESVLMPPRHVPAHDVLLRNILFRVFAAEVGPVTKAVTTVTDGASTPVYDASLLRTFLRRAPELGVALQIVAAQEAMRHERRDVYRNCALPVGTQVWMSLADALPITLQETIDILVEIAHHCFGDAASFAPSAEATAEMAPLGNVTTRSEGTASTATGLGDGGTSSPLSLGGTQRVHRRAAGSVAGSRMTGSDKAMSQHTVVHPGLATCSTTVAHPQLEQSVRKFAAYWARMAKLPRVEDVPLGPASKVLTSGAVQLTGRPLSAMRARRTKKPKKAAPVEVPPIETPPHHEAKEGKKDDKKHDRHGKGEPEAPPPPKITAKLGPALDAMVELPPPIRVEKPHPVAKRRVPLEEPKGKKKPGKK